MRKTKAKLILTLGVALLSVLTMGVSTFAWFQAQAEVDIRAVSDDCEITVSKPDDYTFYYYNKNGTSNYGSPVGTFTSDFSAVTTSELTSGVTLYNNLNPGQSAVFAMKVENLNTSSDNVTLNISKIISNCRTKEVNNPTYKRYVQGGSVEINIGWAIDIYALSSSSSTAYVTNSYNSSTKNFLNASNSNNATTPSASIIKDHFIYAYDTNRSTLEAGTYASPDITTNINLINAETPTNSTMYYFFRVYFSNENSTYYYETNSTGTAVTVPVEDSAANRYFVKGTSGTSNCYAGLTFTLKTMSLTW